MNTIEIGSYVKVIKESKTQGLLGATFKVVNVNHEAIDVLVLNQVVSFKKEAVMPISFKEVWGIEKLPTFYHGTDMRFAALPEDVRTQYLSICRRLIDDLKQYQPLIEEKLKDKVFCEKLRKQDSKLYENLRNAIGHLTIMAFSEEWQYGDFYVTTLKPSAFMYARDAFAGGELAFTAYYLIRGAEMIGIDLTKAEELKSFIEVFKQFAEGTPQPAIFSLDNLDIEHLQPAFGGSIKNYIKDGRLTIDEFRYTAPVVLDMNKAEVFDPDPNKFKEIMSKLR